MRVLLDTNIIRLSQCYKAVTTSASVQWGDETIIWDRPVRKVNEAILDTPQKIHFSECLAAIFEFAKTSNDITFFTSLELTWERARGRSGRTYFDINLLEGINVLHAKCPTSRTVVFGGFDTYGINKGEQIDDLTRICNPRFLELRRTLGDAHLLDIYHLWTAEYNSIEVFLTADQKFRNAVLHHCKKLNAKTKVYKPDELCSELNLAPKSLEQISIDTPLFS